MFYPPKGDAQHIQRGPFWGLFYLFNFRLFSSRKRFWHFRNALRKQAFLKSNIRFLTQNSINESDLNWTPTGYTTHLPPGDKTYSIHPSPSYHPPSWIMEVVQNSTTLKSKSPDFIKESLSRNPNLCANVFYKGNPFQFELNYKSNLTLET